MRSARAALVGLLILVSSATILGACGGPLPGHAASGISGALTASCQSVAAVLSDGPDPTADPVGYAEAQVRPLRALQLPQANLRDAVAALDSAFERVVSTKGTAASEHALSAASTELDAICPGATS
jgi:hypothetical protein